MKQGLLTLTGMSTASGSTSTFILTDSREDRACRPVQRPMLAGRKARKRRPEAVPQFKAWQVSRVYDTAGGGRGPGSRRYMLLCCKGGGVGRACSISMLRTSQ